MSEAMPKDLAGNLEGAVRAFRSGEEARGKGKFEMARTHFLKSAEHLFLAAGDSPGRLKESRVELAQQVLAEAEALKAHPPFHLMQPHRKQISIGGDAQGVSWLVHERPQVGFSDVAGLDDVKEQIRLKLLYPYTHSDIAARYGIQPGGGILLYGPPGTGKTLMARAVAGEIQAAFYAIKPSEVMSKWVGVAEQNLARLFAEAAFHPLSVVFIDEIDSLAPRRRSNASTVMARVVPQLLSELDGFEQRANPLLLIAATNEPWAIDNALLRPGRLDRLIYLPPPDLQARSRILELNLQHAPLAENVSLVAIAEWTENFSGADMASLAQRVRERVFREAVHQGRSRAIEMADFEGELGEMRPSIHTADLRLFERFEK